MHPLLQQLALFLTTFLVVSTLNSTAQQLKGGRYEKGKGAKRSSSSMLKINKTDVFPLDRIYRLGGFTVAPGITYTFPAKAFSEQTTIRDTTYSLSTDPKGRMGWYLELGWFHSFANPSIFHYMDFGLSYKQFKGEESVLLTRTVAGSPVAAFSEKRDFSDQFLSGHYNLTHHRHFSRYGFVNNSIGANVDYAFSTNRSGVLAHPAKETVFPEQLTAQLHYKLGIGWKASEQLLVVPSIETPILTVHSFDNFKSTLPYFHNRYRPIIISIRFLFIRQDPQNCNVPNYDGPKNFE
jgi:hypothetical protein